MRVKFLARACAVGLLLASAPALSTFHLMKVVEVFPGTAASPSAQYVVIQMDASGQQLVGGHAITVFNAAGTQTGSFTFPGNLPNGANQTKILIATTQAESFFGLTADLVMSASILSAGGKVCWAGTLDCVAWGSYHGGSAGVGTPFNAASGLTSGRAAARRLNISGSSTMLDAGDDTDNSANDFVFATPAPRNNAGTLGHVPSATCGNGVIEGLEQCDDHNLNNGDGCSSTCLIDTVVSNLHPVGDYDGDGRSDVFWRNASTGGNVIWKSANSTTIQPTTAVTNLAWKVAGRGDFNGDGKADLLWRNASNGANTIWLSGNSNTPKAVTGVTSQDWQVAGIGDFDADKKADILWHDNATGAGTIWKAGNSATRQSVTTITDTSWRVVGVGDFNGDKRADIVWRSFHTGANTIWYSGNSQTRQAVATLTDQHWAVVGIGDFDGNGRADLLWRSSSSGANIIWLAGNASTRRAVSSLTSQSWQVAQIGDYNGNGKADILWRDYGSGVNTIWLDANSATRQSVSTFNTGWLIQPRESQSIAPVIAAPSSATLSIANITTTEGNSGTHMATFTVMLSKAMASSVTYSIATANGSAVAGSDYVASSLSGQSIPAGSTSRTFPVTIMGDTTYEDNENFTVRLSSVTGASVPNSTATGVISNDDPYYPY